MIARIAPEERLVDLAHGIKSIRAGSASLERSLPFSPRGVHLAVVDPGVGTSRRAVAIVTGSDSILVGPDNGLLIAAGESLGGMAAAFELSDHRFRLQPVSATFHGRDIFAPAAAYLALGIEPSEFGREADVADLVRLDPPHVSVSDGELISDVVFTDWYGNLELAATRDDLETAKLGRRVFVGDAHEAIVASTFADVDRGDLVVYVDSANRIAIACNQGDASTLLQDPARVTLKGKE